MAVSNGLREGRSVILMGWPGGLLVGETGKAAEMRVITLTICVRSVELLHSFIGIVLVLVGHEGNAVRTAGLVVAQLQPDNGADAPEKLL